VRRRDFITGLAVVVTMGSAQGQQTRKVYRIAIAHASTPATDLKEGSSKSPASHAIFEELRRLGYVEGKNLLVERYSGEGRAAHYTELAHEVVDRSPDLIIAFSSHLVLDFEAATRTIPIVGLFSDPIDVGIANVARPGANVTGLSDSIGLGIWGKRLQLLKEAVPRISKVGFLASRDWWEDLVAEMLRVAPKASVSIVGRPLDRPIQEEEYRRAFSNLAQQGADGLVVDSETDHVTHRTLIVELAEKARLPAMYSYPLFVEAGGLMAYGVDAIDVGYRTARLVDQILKGAKPGEIPVLQPTKFELSINLKTAKALGIDVPSSLLVSADKVIE
jgi:putative ABC transport system substrate-binding protein